MVNISAGEEIPQGEPVFHSDYESAGPNRCRFGAIATAWLPVGIL